MLLEPFLLFGCVRVVQWMRGRTAQAKAPKSLNRNVSGSILGRETRCVAMATGQNH